MKNKRIFLIIANWLFLVFFVTGQENTKGFGKLPYEKVYLSTNTNVFLAGEVLNYKFFCLNKKNNSPSFISKTGYVELIGEHEEILFKQKLKLENSVGFGDYFIPSDIKTGQYKLLAYTKWIDISMPNPIFAKDLYIINPYVPNLNENKVSNKINVFVDENVENSKIATDLQNIQIKITPNATRPRSLVSIDLENNYQDLLYGNYMLSVRMVSSIVVENKLNNEKNIKVKQDNEINFLPELRGEIISGIVKSKMNDSIIPEIIVSLSIPGKDFVFKNVKTDQFGRFCFNLYENYKTSDVLVQVVDSQKDEYKIILDDHDFIDYSSLAFSKVYLDQNITDWLVKQSIYNQIENAYYDSRKDSVLEVSPPKLFYGKPTIAYLLSDYKRFPTLKETFIEVIQAGAIRNQKEDFKFKVYDYSEGKYSSFSDYEPLVLFDGVLIQNKDEIMGYEAKDIESIDLVRGTYFYGPSIFHGIIDIKSKNGDFRLVTNGNDRVSFNIEAPIKSKIFYNPKYDEKELNDLKRIPDYRTQLLWIPNIKINSNLKTVNFYTSDIEGVFEILLEGFTKTGRHLISKKYFEVKNK